MRKDGFRQSHSSVAANQGLRRERATAGAGKVKDFHRSRQQPPKRHRFVESALRAGPRSGGTLQGGMAEESNADWESQALGQGLTDLRQAWDHLARELAPGVPELPGVIEQALVALTFAELNEEALTRVSDSVVARVADAGLPEQAAALSRRMGRAMYELLLLLATQEEIRDMGAALAAITPAEPAGPKASAKKDEKAEEKPTVSGKPETSPPVSAAPLPPPTVSIAAGAVEAWQLEPRDPVRPARVQKGTPPPAAKLAPTEAAKPEPASGPGQVPSPAAVPAASKGVAPPAPDAAPVPEAPEPLPPTTLPQPVPKAATPAPQPALSQLGALAAQPPGPAAPPAPRATTPAPEDGAPRGAAVPASPPATRPAAAPVAEVPKAPSPPVASPPALTPGPGTRDLTDEEAPLWGFDPAAREPGPEAAQVERSVPDRPAKVAAAAAASPRRGGQLAVGERRPELVHHSGWTVRLSPRISTEQERKLEARQAELPVLLEEIAAAAKSQQEAIPAKSNARRALEAKQSLSLAEGTDPAGQIQALLDEGHLDNAAAMAVQFAKDRSGAVAAELICDVGDAVHQAKQLDLAVLCFATAVITSPPCDRACWKLCTLSVERQDTTMAPVWLEFVARLLRARGSDPDAISVYRQLLKLTPRRSDIRELLRISSLTGVLPD